MSRLIDLVIKEDTRLLQLLSICDMSENKQQDDYNCNIPYKKVLSSKIKDLINDV